MGDKDKLIDNKEVTTIVQRIINTCNAHGSCYDDNCPFYGGDIEGEDSICIFAKAPCEIEISRLENAEEE